MVIHFPGTPLTEIESGFTSNFCKAEQIWKTAEKNGKKCILMKYIASWPPNIENVLQVEGFGAPGGPGVRPWGSSPQTISNSSFFSSELLTNGKKIEFYDIDHNSWQSRSEVHSNIQAKEGKLKLGLDDVVFYVLLIAKNSNIYDTAIFSKNKNIENSFSLTKGQLSEWQTENFLKEGKKIPAAFRLKLLDIGKENKEIFKLYVTQIFPLGGWTHPKSLAKELVDKFGPFLESISHFPYVFGWIDEETYITDMEYQAEWLGKSSEYLMEKYDWDLYMTQWHGIDNTQHAFLRFDKSVLTEKEARIGDYVTLRSYEIADNYVSKIMNGVKYSKNDEIHTLVLSDHGHVMGKRRFFINDYLYEKGLITLKRDTFTKKISIDWKKTKAFAQGMVSVYVNLKDRDPDGCVNPGKEYDSVVEEIISLLYDVKDPKTNQRPIVLALSNQNAEFIGLSGDRSGDVIVAANPVYALDNRIGLDELFEDLKIGLPDGSIHGAQLPALDLKEYGTIKSMLIAHGPKIKKDYIVEKPINIVNIAPTLSHLLDIPAPKNCEGVVIKEILE